MKYIMKCHPSSKYAKLATFHSRKIRRHLKSSKPTKYTVVEHSRHDTPRHVCIEDVSLIPILNIQTENVPDRHLDKNIWNMKETRLSVWCKHSFTWLHFREQGGASSHLRTATGTCNYRSNDIICHINFPLI
jgi:hypothetical protein